MQSQKISSKFFTARELADLQMFYRARSYKLTLSTISQKSSISFNSYIIYGTIRTLSPNKRINFRSQFISKDNVKQIGINFTLLPIVVSQSVIGFSQLTKISSYIKGTTYQIIIQFPVKNIEDFKQDSIKQIRILVEQLKKLQFNEHDKLDFIPSRMLIPTAFGCLTPILFKEFNQNKLRDLSKIQLTQLQLYYIMNVRYIIFNIIKLIFVE